MPGYHRILQIWLLSGLVIHKAVWEIMKLRKPRAEAPQSQPPKARLLSAAKIAILGGLVVQVFLDDVFPISTHPLPFRAAGVSVYTLGLLLAITARIQLGMNWSDIEKSKLVEGHQLVARGLYGYVRHPIYTGDLLLLTGFELALNSWAVLGIAAVALYVRRQAVGEERKLLSSLPGYQEYYKKTFRFFPLFKKT